MVDFKSIETFLWVVTLGSFRGAGQRLNTTQPAISQRIAQLEREMGVKLLNRDHRVASPTPSGRQMLVYAEKLIGLRAEMMTEICDRSAVRGVLRAGPRTAYDVARTVYAERWSDALAPWLMTQTLAWLIHLEALGEAGRTAGESTETWSLD